MIAMLIAAMLGEQMVVHQFMLDDAIRDIRWIKRKNFGVKIQIHRRRIKQLHHLYQATLRDYPIPVEYVHLTIHQTTKRNGSDVHLNRSFFLTMKLAH